MKDTYISTALTAGVNTAWLEAQGYARFTVRYFVRLAADLSRWLEGEFCIPGAPVEFPEAKDIGNKEHDEEPDD